MSCAFRAVRSEVSGVKGSRSSLLTPYSLLLTLDPLPLLLPDLSQQLLPLLVFLLILRSCHACLGIEPFEFGLIHRAVEAELGEKFLAVGTEQEITEQQRRMW